VLKAKIKKKRIATYDDRTLSSIKRINFYIKICKILINSYKFERLILYNNLLFKSTIKKIILPLAAIIGLVTADDTAMKSHKSFVLMSSKWYTICANLPVEIR
jgi:hypothetical protein